MVRNPLNPMRRARRFFLRALCLFLFAVPACAQTVRPLLLEHGEKAHGKFELVNDTLMPLTVVLEAKSFSVDERGEISYRPLDPHIHLKLARMSFRIPPQQSYWVFYEATADQLPAWFVLYANFTGYPFKSASGMNIQLELPHTVYLLPKGDLKRPDVSLVTAEYRAGAHKIVVEVSNQSALFGRALGAEISGGREKATQNGFPLFPNSHRRVEIAWEGDEPPQKLKLRFAKFTLEQPIAVRQD